MHTGVSLTEQYLISQGHILVEGTLAENGITNLSTISVCARLLGGACCSACRACSLGDCSSSTFLN